MINLEGWELNQEEVIKASNNSYWVKDQQVNNNLYDLLNQENVIYDSKTFIKQTSYYHYLSVTSNSVSNIMNKNHKKLNRYHRLESDILT